MIEALQKPCLLGTARIIRKVLDMKSKKNETAVPNTTACYCGISIRKEHET